MLPGMVVTLSLSLVHFSLIRFHVRIYEPFENRQKFISNVLIEMKGRSEALLYC